MPGPPAGCSPREGHSLNWGSSCCGHRYTAVGGRERTHQLLLSCSACPAGFFFIPTNKGTAQDDEARGCGWQGPEVSPRVALLVKVLSNLKIKFIPPNGQKNDAQQPTTKPLQQAEMRAGRVCPWERQRTKEKLFQPTAGARRVGGGVQTC